MGVIVGDLYGFMEQLIILGNGAIRVSAREFREEIAVAEEEIREILKDNSLLS